MRKITTLFILFFAFTSFVRGQKYTVLSALNSLSKSLKLELSYSSDSLNPDKSIKKGRYPELLPTNLIIYKGKVVFFKQGFSEVNIAQMDSVLNQLSVSQ